MIMILIRVIKNNDEMDYQIAIIVIIYCNHNNDADVYYDHLMT